MICYKFVLSEIYISQFKHIVAHKVDQTATKYFIAWQLVISED